MKIRFVGQIILSIFALILTECDPETSIICTARLCDDSFRLKIYQADSYKMAAEKYTAEFSTPGRPDVVVNFELIYEGDTRETLDVISADGPVYADSWDGTVQFDIEHIFRLSKWDRTKLPDEISEYSVTIKSESVLLGEQTFYPEYKWYWCNGSEHCDSRQNYTVEDKMRIDSL